MKHSTLVSLVLLCMTLVGLPTAAQITGWDEVGPTISGAQESLTAVKKNGLWGFATQKNKAKIKPKYEAIGDTVCFLTTSGTTLNQGILIQEKGKWGLLGADGKILIKPEYDSFGDFYSTESNGYSKTPYEGRAVAKVVDRKYLVNSTAKS